MTLAGTHGRRLPDVVRRATASRDPRRWWVLNKLSSWNDGWTGLDPVVFGPPAAREACSACGAEIAYGPWTGGHGQWFHIRPLALGRSHQPHPAIPGRV